MNRLRPVQFVAVFLLMAAAVAAAEQVIPVKTVYGVQYETDESWLVYQRVAPIIYKYQVPSTYQNFLEQLFSKYSTPCAQPATAKLLQGWCPLMTTLTQLGSYFESAFSLKQIFSAPESEQPYFLDLYCQLIRKSFPSLQTDETVLKDYLSNLKNCTGPLFIEEDGVFERNESEPGFASVFQLLQDSYYEAIGFASTTNENFINSEIIPVALGFLIYFAETQKWRTAVADCNAGNIPKSLVQQSQLQNSLEKLQDVLRDKFDETLVIGNSDTEVSEYYHRKLTDCTISGSVFYVRIHVPVKQGRPQLHQIRSLPFLTSSSNSSSVCYISQFKSEWNIVYDFTSGSVLESDCVDKTELCYSPKLSYSNAFFHQNSCAKTLFSYPVNNDTFATACTLTCEPVGINFTSTSFPLIRKIARNSYHVVGLSGTFFSIEIDATVEAAEARTVFDTQINVDIQDATTSITPTNSTIVKFPESGAVQVTIPCNSRLIIEKDGGNVTFFAMSPCIEDLEIIQVQLYQLAQR